MGLGGRLAALGVGAGLGLGAASEFAGWEFRWPVAFGCGLRLSSDLILYWPWSYLAWRSRFGAQHPQVWSGGLALILLGLAIGVGLVLLFQGDGVAKSRRVRGWGGRADARRAGLLDNAGCVLGELNGRLLTTQDLRPTLVTGGTRSGKGRGHVAPTLLSWTASVLVNDPKGELWTISAGWRSLFSHALVFNPRDPTSARFNPLAEIRRGPQEVAEVQRWVAILSDPGGGRDDEAIWDKSATELLEAVILHVLYTATDEEKSLVTVVRLLADLDDTVVTMVRTLHREGVDGEGETHPFIERAGLGYGAMHDRFRTSV